MNCKLRNILSLLSFALAVTLIFPSCGDDTENPGETNTNITGNITENTTWTADNDYVIDGRVIVTNGATLTIEPGTVIKAEGGADANASVLIIATDGKIEANGTASEPIIFTSVSDEIVSGEIVSPNLVEASKGLWGGVVVLGLAPISPQTGTTAIIEGIPADVVGNSYGGDNPTHNSGTLNYVSIRHGGIALNPDNEINGLTLGGVGSGTSISNIEVVSNVDDGIECFGGTVNITNAAVLYQGDDAFDIDQAYAGTISNFIFIGSEANDSDNALEIDGPEGSENADGKFTLEKGSFAGFMDDLSNIRSDAQGTIRQLYYTDYTEKNFEIQAQATVDKYLNGDLTVTACAFNDSRTLDQIVLTKEVSSTDSLAVIDVFTASSNGNAVTDTPAAGVGASLAEFAGWSYASESGALSIFQ